MNPYTCDPSFACAAQTAAFMLFMNSIRYFPLAGAAWFLLWWWKRDFFLPARIQDKWPAWERIAHELKHSLGTLFIFAGLGVLSVVMGRLGWNRVYLDAGEYGLAYLFFSFVVLMLWQETWFYWMHRLIHRRGWFRLIHRVHHVSGNPSPFAAYGFHPLEAILEGAYIIPLTFVLPLHPGVILAQIEFTMLMNIWWHSGYEFFPTGWTRGKWTRWLNTATHHNMHHSHVNGNFSLYLNFWDRVMGTNFPGYDDYFETVARRRDESSAKRRAAHALDGP